MAQQTQKLEKYLRSLSALEKTWVKLVMEVFNADAGNIFGMDLVVAATANRSLSNLRAFVSLIRSDNLLAAGPIIRMELDTLLRLSAFWICDEPHIVALKVLSGTHLRSLRDRSGTKMTDRYLCKNLEERDKLDWIRSVYDKTSGYIHLSRVHMIAPFINEENSERDSHDGSFTLEITGKSTAQHFEVKLEAAECLLEIESNILRYVYGWGYTKANVKRP